ncbi:MAG: hypothetical protein CVU56_06500 [Deltaproteobacteria bacterium HGW-Deltaproteobacteria-14]|jgi:hypothetical protein|nr:MAG: hypothetical protein CVU56_06500 [Deltaproteobacteria bacterium HGW-Deltaproteobacteria-14]
MPIAALRSISDHMDEIVRHVKAKRLAAEVARADKAFHFRYFKGLRPEKIGRALVRKIIDKEIIAEPGHELFANLLIIHWNEGHAKLYEEMVTHVRTINEDVEAIERIEDEMAHAIIDDLLLRHAQVDILLCVRLNGVRFDEELVQSRLVRGEPRPAGDAPAGDAPAGEGAPADAAAPAE